MLLPVRQREAASQSSGTNTGSSSTAVSWYNDSACYWDCEGPPFEQGRNIHSNRLKQNLSKSGDIKR